MNDITIEQFHNLVKQNKIEDLAQIHSSFNVKQKTLGGNVFWHNIAQSQGWKLQKNYIFQNWRILNPENIRVAWGSEEQIVNLIWDKPTSLMANYFDEGKRFLYYPAKEKPLGTIILIHGWSARAYWMRYIAEYFSNANYNVLSYDYPTSANGIWEHGLTFLKNYQNVLKTLKPNEKVSIITHSMGGLVLRSALANMSESEIDRIGNVVMLAPPNQGSKWAEAARILNLEKYNKALTDMGTSKKSYINNLQPPKKYPNIGIIYGTYDIKVEKNKTKIIGLNHESVGINCTHNSILVSLPVCKKAKEFIANGTFTK